MYWLFRTYLNTIFYALAVVAAILPAGMIAQASGHYFEKSFGIDSQLMMGFIFFAVFTLEAYLFDLVRKWWFFKPR
jgi:hypothetical protein